MLEIGTHITDTARKAIILQQQVRELFSNAAEWRAFDMWEAHDGLEQEITGAMQQAFIDQAKEKGNTEEIDNYECVVLKVPTQHCKDAKAAIRNLITAVDQKGKVSASPLKNYAEYKRAHYSPVQPVTYQIDEGQSHDDDQHVYLAIFMHPLMRAIIATDLLQQETSCQNDGRLYRTR